MSTSKTYVYDTLDSPVVIKHAPRQVLFTRPSNDDVTNLTRVGGSSQASDELPKQQGEVPISLTLNCPPKNKWRVVTSCALAFVLGFADATPGAILPHMESYYNISYSVVSLIWIVSAVGYIFVASISHLIQKYVGRSRNFPISGFFLIVAYSIISSGGPFPLILVGFFFTGVGVAMVVAFVNVFLAKFDKQSKYLAFFHGSYGIGATVSPLFATLMVNQGVKWNFFYIILVGFMIITATGAYLSYRGAQEDLYYWYEGNAASDQYNSTTEEEQDIVNTQREVVDSSEDEEAIGMHNLGPHRVNPTAVPESQPASQDMKLALKLPITWLLSMWVFFYQGSEVAMGGWIVTYLLDYRGANNTYGYVASGFWGGLALGRLFLTRPLHKYLGGRRALTVVSSLAILFSILTWVIPNNYAASACVCISGALIGPNYPLMITVVTSGMIPRRIQVVALTIVSSFGSSGGALLPFIVGLLSQRFSSYVILPTFIITYSLMLLIWICLPNLERRRALGTSKLTLWQKFW